jgi:mRNA-degrading endonuclease RelE of RelBE toxin-antitoxin system
MQKRIEWTPQARVDLWRIDRKTALHLLEDLADYVLTGYGHVEHLTDVQPPELRRRPGDYRVRFYDLGNRLLIIRVLNRKDAYR